MKLSNGSKVAVIGGGPAGSFFSYFLMRNAKHVDLSLNVDVYEYQDFSLIGPHGCNLCGGIISERLVQSLTEEGIILPENVVQRGIDSYVLHTDLGSRRLVSQRSEKGIVSVFRGGGPKESGEITWDSFDKYLQDLTIKEGVNLIKKRVTKLNFDNGRPSVTTHDKDNETYDLLVGAVGINTTGYKLLGELGFGYKPPQMMKTFICEYNLGYKTIQKYFGSSMHVFLLNIPRLKFAAIIPKGNFVTMTILGSDIDQELVQSFMKAKAVIDCFPPDFDVSNAFTCLCYPKINVRRSIKPFTDRVVLIGDCGVSRLYKDGIRAAFSTAKSAARIVVDEGISNMDFRKYYWPECKSLYFDNRWGKFVFDLTRLIQINKITRKAILNTVIDEQRNRNHPLPLNAILWDIFTGNAPYKNIFLRAIKPKLIFNILLKMFKKSS